MICLREHFRCILVVEVGDFVREGANLVEVFNSCSAYFQNVCPECWDVDVAMGLSVRGRMNGLIAQRRVEITVSGIYSRGASTTQFHHPVALPVQSVRLLKKISVSGWLLLWRRFP